MKRLLGYVILIVGLVSMKFNPVGIIPAIIIFIILNRASKGSIDEAMLPKELRQDKRSTAEIIGKGAGKAFYKLKNTLKKSSENKITFRVTNCRVSSTVEAIVWVGTKKKQLHIPVRQLMYACSDPLNWKEIDTLELNKDTLGELADEIFSMLEQHNEILAEI